MKCIAKCKNWGSMEVGHPRSPAMLPFDRAHTTSYSTLTESMCLPYTVFELKRVSCQKCPILTHHPTAFGAPVGLTLFEFREDLRRQKTRVPGLLWRYLRDPIFNSFDTMPACDG